MPLSSPLRPALSGLMACALLLSPHAAEAGRPLSVEDAGVNDFRNCQVEFWLDRTDNENVFFPGVACGVADGLELGVGLAAPRRTSRADQGRELALKWAPEWAQWQGWRWGAKLAKSFDRPAGETRWQDGAINALGIASYPFGDALTLHLNGGVEFTRRPAEANATAGLALAWTPADRWIVFAEMFGAQRSGATRGAGLRYWVVPEVLGLDLTAQRTNTAGGVNTYTVGLGWYGLKF